MCIILIKVHTVILAFPTKISFVDVINLIENPPVEGLQSILLLIWYLNCFLFFIFKNGAIVPPSLKKLLYRSKN